MKSIRTIIITLMLMVPASVYGLTAYEIEAAGNDEKFVIDGDLYVAQSYCLGWDEGDRVIFIDGTPGVCVTATLYNMDREEKCDVWCE